MAAQWQAASGFDASRADQNAKKQNEYWSPKNGTTVFRLLPPGKEGCQLFREGWWTARYFKHWVKLPKMNAAAGDKQENLAIYDGPRSAPGKFTTNPIADAINEASAYLPAEAIKGLRSKARCLANILIKEIYDERNNRIDTDLTGKMVVADLPIGFHDHIKKDRANPVTGDYLNPFHGLDIMMRRSGTGQMNTEYAYAVRPGANMSPILDDMAQLQKLLAEVPDLAELIVANCVRDQELAAQAASGIREWIKSLQANNPFGSAPQTTGGYVPGPMPGMPHTQPGGNMPPPNAWPAPPAQQAAPAAPVWPTHPPMPPQSPLSSASNVPPAWPVPGNPVPPAAQAPVSWPTSPPAPHQHVQQQAIPTMVAPQATAPAPAPQAAPVRPACYKEFIKRNGTDSAAADSPTDPTCRTCVYKVPCAFESVAP